MVEKIGSLQEYHYQLPEEKIAQYPLVNRDAAKLLLYKNSIVSHSQFKDVLRHVPKEATLFMNNTKVIAARLFFQKSTGAKIEVFLTQPADYQKDVQLSLAYCDTSSWYCIIGNLKKWKDGDVLELVIDDTVLKATLEKRETGEVKFSWNSKQSFSELIEKVGHIPLPPYMKRADEKNDKSRYQTVFSTEEGAVAAPTAGLHFTQDILDQLHDKGVSIEKLTLHVSAGTFRPITAKKIEDHDMHNEQIIVTKKNIDTIINAIGPIIAIGTTSLRTLESLYWYGVQLLKDQDSKFFINKTAPYKEQQTPSLHESLKAVRTKMDREEVDELRGNTEIFIYPGYKFRVVDALFTNFHMPGSTLILLVAAFVGKEWQKIYQEALENNYRFLSYGDTSLLFRSPQRK